MKDRDQEIHDVLIKAGEDVQQGMWCTGAWFTEDAENDDGLSWAPEEAFKLTMTVESLSKLHRCAEGSIALATITARLPLSVYHHAVGKVENNLPNHCGSCDKNKMLGADYPLHEHNDGHMKEMDPFTAGQHLAWVFQDTADRMTA